MLGFFSKEIDMRKKVTKDQIYFVSIPENAPVDEVKIAFASKAKLFADKLNINKVFLHFGKDSITYDFKI